MLPPCYQELDGQHPADVITFSIRPLHSIKLRCMASRQQLNHENSWRIQVGRTRRIASHDNSADTLSVEPGCEISELALSSIPTIGGLSVWFIHPSVMSLYATFKLLLAANI